MLSLPGGPRLLDERDLLLVGRPVNVPEMISPASLQHVLGLTMLGRTRVRAYEGSGHCPTPRLCLDALER